MRTDGVLLPAMLGCPCSACRSVACQQAYVASNRSLQPDCVSAALQCIVASGRALESLQN